MTVDMVLSMAELEARYSGNWVLLLDPETDEQLTVLGGRLFYYSPDRDEFDETVARLLRPEHREIAVFFVGPWPDDVDGYLL